MNKPFELDLIKSVVYDVSKLKFSATMVNIIVVDAFNTERIKTNTGTLRLVSRSEYISFHKKFAELYKLDNKKKYCSRLKMLRDKDENDSSIFRANILKRTKNPWINDDSLMDM